MKAGREGREGKGERRREKGGRGRRLEARVRKVGGAKRERAGGT